MQDFIYKYLLFILDKNVIYSCDVTLFFSILASYFNFPTATYESPFPIGCVFVFIP